MLTCVERDDWGTSRLYVLGLAFYFTGHASPLYLGAMSLIMIAVAADTFMARSFGRLKGKAV